MSRHRSGAYRRAQAPGEPVFAAPPALAVWVVAAPVAAPVDAAALGEDEELGVDEDDGVGDFEELDEDEGDDESCGLCDVVEPEDAEEPVPP